MMARLVEISLISEAGSRILDYFFLTKHKIKVISAPFIPILLLVIALVIYLSLKENASYFFFLMLKKKEST